MCCAARVTNRITFAMTGNNIQVGRKIGRRSYMINLDAGMSNPEDRPASSYRHPELREWIRENRGRIVWALFVIIRAWFADGQPSYELPHMGSFERWTCLVGGILTHAGFGGFLANRGQLRADADQETAQWEAFLSRWRELFGDDPKSIADIASDLISEDRLGGVIPEDLSRCTKGHETNNVRIGKVFKKREGCRFGPRQLRICQGTIIRGQGIWTVFEEMELPTVCGQADESEEAAETLARPTDGSEPGEQPVFGVNSLDLTLLPDEWGG